MPPRAHHLDDTDIIELVDTEPNRVEVAILRRKHQGCGCRCFHGRRDDPIAPGMLAFCLGGILCEFTPRSECFGWQAYKYFARPQQNIGGLQLCIQGDYAPPVFSQLLGAGNLEINPRRKTAATIKS